MMVKKAAFTMIELLVSITIIGILAAIAGPSFTEFIDASRLSFSTQLVETTLGKAFSETRAKPVSMVLRGWKGSQRMELVTSGASASEKECRLTENTCQQLDAGVTFENNFKVRFLPPYGDIKNNGDDTEIVLVGKTKKITVKVHHASGLIETLKAEKL